MTLSSTLMRPSGFTTWNVLPMPRWQILCVGSRWISCPLKMTRPEVGRWYALIMLNVVVLPDPLGPMRPRISPFSTWKETPLTAARPPKYLTSFSTWKYATRLSLSSGGGFGSEDGIPDFRPVSHDPVGQHEDHHDHQDSEPENVRAGDRLRDRNNGAGSGNRPQILEEAEEPGTEQFLDRHHDECPHHRAVDRPHTPDDPHEDRHDGDVVEGKHHVGIDEAHVVHVEGARHPRPERRDGQREHLVVMGIDPEAFRGALVLQDGDEVVPGLGVDDPLDAGHGGDRHPQGDVIVGDLRHEGGHDQDADHPPGEPFRDGRAVPHDLVERQGGQGEVGPPHPETDPAERQADGNGCEPPEGESPPGGDVEMDGKEARGVRARSEKGGIPDGDMTGITRGVVSSRSQGPR